MKKVLRMVWVTVFFLGACGLAYGQPTPTPVNLTCELLLDYSTYLGGSDTDTAWAIAVGSDLCAYVAGQSWSADFPTVVAYQAQLPGFGNVVVSKLSAAGGSLVYSTYVGGSVVDETRGIAVDSAGSAYVGGYTISHDFPTVNPYQGGLGGGFGDFDYFVFKLSPSGSELLYSTYLGGSDPEQGGAVAVDGDLCAYVTGMTYSADFPTLNPYQGAIRGSSAATVSKLSAAGSSLLYSTFLGGSAGQAGNGVAVDGDGRAYVVGETDSADFPTVNPFQAYFNAETETDAFVAKFSSSGTDLVYSTYLGGSGLEIGRSLAVNASGAAVVIGITDSDDFPTFSAFQPSRAGNDDVWVAELSPSGSSLILGTYLGSSADDDGWSVAVDGEGRIYAAGETCASDFPLEIPYRSVMEGIEAFVTCFNPSGSALFYSTFLGGSGDDYGRAIAVDGEGSAYVTGFTDSTDFPAVNAFQPAYAGGGDIFVGKLRRSCHLTTPTSSATPTPEVIHTATPAPSATPPTPAPTPSVTPISPVTPSPTLTPVTYPTPPYLVLDSGDYNGDGLADIAVFRQESGLWAVRGLGRVYFGASGDRPVPGDYNGDGVTDVAVFRPSSGLWAVKTLTRFYFGCAQDCPVPGDYSGDGVTEAAIFQRASGLWAVRGLTRFYFGRLGDLPVPADYSGGGAKEIGIFRGLTGLWAVRGVTRAYFGRAGDSPLPGYYRWYASEKEAAPFRAEIAVFRPASGLWAIRGWSRWYFGRAGDSPLRGDFTGNSLDAAAVFRPAPGLWAVRGITRAYFGRNGDIPVTR